MPYTTIHSLSIVLLLTIATSAQLLTTGTTDLPACAQDCTLLNQAVAACNGQTTSDQATWICFCQSGYLTTLYSSATDICDTACTNATQNEEVTKWYTTNCGTDDGASEHLNSAVTSTTAATAVTTTATTATTTTSGSATVTLAGTLSPVVGNVATADGEQSESGSWILNHYKWIIMLLVLVIGLVILACLFTWLRRRHDRQQDLSVGGFNQGITLQSAPMAAVQPVDVPPSSGRDSATRTRDAFMPYGYGFARSESRLGSRTQLPEIHKGSPLAHHATTFTEFGKDVEAGTPTSKKKRIYVRERSMTDDLDKV